MTKYLLDTDIIINFLRTQNEIDENFLYPKGYISIITYIELGYGFIKNNQHIDDLNIMLNILNIEVLNLNIEITNTFNTHKIKLEKKGIKIEDFDLLIASTAIYYDYTLVTYNLKHFKRVEGLKISSVLKTNDRIC